MKSLLVLVIITLSICSYSQHRIPSSFKGKYHMLSPEELKIKDNNIKTNRLAETLPPIAPVRNIAEFEPMEGVLVSYPDEFGLSLELIKEMSEDVIVYTIVYNQNDADVVTQLYDNYGVNMSNSQFIFAPLDSYWSRDYTPWYIFDGNEDFGILDFDYNRPRYNDNAFPKKMANIKGINYYAMNIEHTGGNYMTDGIGISASTKLVISENNDVSKQHIINKHNDFLGIKKYHFIDDPQGEYIQHIDCWGKFLAVDKILITKVNESDSRYNDYENIANFFSNEISSYGTKYKVYRTYSPNDQPYTNSLILNKKVLVPIISGYTQENTDALNVYKDALPGYEVIGIFAAPGYAWEATDALHCRTHGVPDAEMIYINHLPISGIIEEENKLYIKAEVITHSTKQLQSVTMNYKTETGGNYITINMDHVSGNTYEAEIDLSSVSISTIYYYLKAIDSSGKFTTHPFTGSNEPHIAQIKSGPYFTSSPELNAFVGHEYTYQITTASSNTTSNISISCTKKPYWLKFTDNGDNTGTLSGTPIFSQIGGHTVSLTLDDGATTSESNYILTVKNITGIKRIPDDAVRIHPNPTTGRICINLTGIEEKKASISVINNIGQVVWSRSEIKTMEKEHHINLKNNGKGIFFIKIETKSGFLVKKVVVF